MFTGIRYKTLVYFSSFSSKFSRASACGLHPNAKRGRPRCGAFSIRAVQTRFSTLFAIRLSRNNNLAILYSIIRKKINGIRVWGNVSCRLFNAALEPTHKGTHVTAHILATKWFTEGIPFRLLGRNCYDLSNLVFVHAAAWARHFFINRCYWEHSWSAKSNSLARARASSLQHKSKNTDRRSLEW